MCFEYLGRVECYVSLRFLWMKIFGRYLHHEGGDCAKSFFEDFWRAGPEWPLCKISTCTVPPSCFLSISTTFLTNMWPKYSPLDLWAVSRPLKRASTCFLHVQARASYTCEHVTCSYVLDYYLKMCVQDSSIGGLVTQCVSETSFDFYRTRVRSLGMLVSD